MSKRDTRRQATRRRFLGQLAAGAALPKLSFRSASKLSLPRKDSWAVVVSISLAIICLCFPRSSFGLKVTVGRHRLSCRGSHRIKALLVFIVTPDGVNASVRCPEHGV